jgi:hypothetical protein
MAVEIKTSGKVDRVYKDGEYYGEIISLPNGYYRWRNPLADRMPSPFTCGEVKTKTLALMMLGFKPRKPSARPKRPKPPKPPKPPEGLNDDNNG